MQRLHCVCRWMHCTAKDCPCLFMSGRESESLTFDNTEACFKIQCNQLWILNQNWQCRVLGMHMTNAVIQNKQMQIEVFSPDYLCRVSSLHPKWSQLTQCPPPPHPTPPHTLLGNHAARIVLLPASLREIQMNATKLMYWTTPIKEYQLNWRLGCAFSGRKERTRK